MNSHYNFLVCVRCFTFNHAPYIKDAMDGFCMQQTSFPFVCVIVDDASTDGEQDVIRAYMAKNFNLEEKGVVRNEETDDYTLIYARHKTNTNCFFAVYYLKYNHYSIKKDKFTYFSEFFDHVKYHAPCEGDDYWINPSKLQLQTDYLEKNPNCLLCYGKGKYYVQSTHKFSNKTVGEDFVSFEQLLQSNTVSTMTTMMRLNAYKSFLLEEKTWKYKNWRMGDYPSWLWFAANGDCHFFNNIFGVYRILEESASHSKDVNQQMSFVLDYKDIQLYFIKKFGISSRVKFKVLCRDEFTLLKLFLKLRSYKVFTCMYRIVYYAVLYIGITIFAKNKC